MSIIEERALALEKQKIKEAKRLDFHRFVLEQLLTDRKDEILKKAKNRVSLWERDDLCSNYYISKWSRIIDSNLDVFKFEILENKNNNANALMQNSPFSFLMSEFE